MDAWGIVCIPVACPCVPMQRAVWARKDRPWEYKQYPMYPYANKNNSIQVRIKEETYEKTHTGIH
jgi:hypothetical protein